MYVACQLPQRRAQRRQRVRTAAALQCRWFAVSLSGRCLALDCVSPVLLLRRRALPVVRQPLRKVQLRSADGPRPRPCRRCSIDLDL